MSKSRKKAPNRILARRRAGCDPRPPEWSEAGWPGHTEGVPMPYATILRGGPRKRRTRSRRAHRSVAPGRLARRAGLALRVRPLAVRIVVGTVLLVAVWAAVNWMVQVARKPTEVFFSVSGSLAKSPAQTWRQYGPLFAKHSTA